MTERQIRERRHAVEQRFASVDRRTRELQLRAFRGAVRTAAADLVTPGVYDSLVSVLEVVVPSGRWLATGTATFTVPAPAASVDLHLKIVTADPLTDVELIDPNYDLPAARYQAAHTSQVIITLRCAADIIHIPDSNLKVTLRSMNGQDAAYRLTDCRLVLNPV